MPTCQKKDQLCRCIDWPDEDFDVEIDHFIRNFEFLHVELEYASLDAREPVRVCRIGRCRVCGGRMCDGTTLPPEKTVRELMPTICLLAGLAFQQFGYPLPAGTSSFREVFPTLFHEEDQAFAKQWLSEPEGWHLMELCCGDGEMKKKKITFSEPNCRFGCPHFKSVGSVLNETCYCMKKGKKGRRLGKKDLKRRPPEWCPRRLKTPVCRIYGFKDEMHEALELDNRLNFEPDKHDWYFPSSHHYQLQSEFPLGMTAEQFYNALQEEPVESVLNGTPLKNGELIEIDDGLASHFFYCYSQSTVLPAKVFGLEHEGGAHHA